MISPLSPDGRLLMNELIGTEEPTLQTCDSIYSRLKNFFRGSDEALDPSPTLDAILTELVSYLQGRHLDLPRYSGCSFSEVEREVCREIDENEKLRSKANFVRDIANRSEPRLERYYARRIAASRGVHEPNLPIRERVRRASCGFPYLDNYLNMVEKESCIIRTFLEEEDRLKFRTSTKRENFAEEWSITIAFCGSGPLPFTGILLAVFMRVKVVLIDSDCEAIELSKKVVHEWEQGGIIPEGTVSVLWADGMDLTFMHPGYYGTHRAMSGLVMCHVLFIASLIPDSAKEAMVRKISVLQDAGPLVIMRSAHGLTARLAYYQTRRDVLTRHLHLVGLVAPKVHELSNGFIVDDEVRPIEFFTSEILNSLEIYSWRAKGNRAV